MQDAAYIVRLMCELNVLPLALQITNIAGSSHFIYSLENMRRVRKTTGLWFLPFFLVIAFQCMIPQAAPSPRKKDIDDTCKSNLEN
jgi:hypothetical protein